MAFVLALAWGCASAELTRTPGAPPPSDSTGGSDDPGDPASATGDGGHERSPDAGAPIAASSNVTIQVEPADSGYAVLNAIKGAKKSVHMTMYLLSNDQVISALVSLAKAGKDVKVVLNQTFPPNAGSNQDAYDTLTSGGVRVVWAPSAYQYTHAKTVIIDGATLLVMTMNLTYSSAKTNREYIATDLDPQDVQDAETVFDTDFRNVQSYVATTKLVLSPKSATSIDARSRLAALVDSAKTSLDVEVEELSDDAIVDAIVAAQKANVKTRVVLNGGNDISPAQQDAIDKLKAAGVSVVLVSTLDIHAKAIVVDGARAYVGSQNFTGVSLANNREVGIVTDAAAEVAKVQTAIATDFAAGTAP